MSPAKLRTKLKPHYSAVLDELGDEKNIDSRKIPCESKWIMIISTPCCSNCFFAFHKVVFNTSRCVHLRKTTFRQLLLSFCKTCQTCAFNQLYSLCIYPKLSLKLFFPRKNRFLTVLILSDIHFRGFYNMKSSMFPVQNRFLNYVRKYKQITTYR